MPKQRSEIDTRIHDLAGRLDENTLCRGEIRSSSGRCKIYKDWNTQGIHLRHEQDELHADVLLTSTLTPVSMRFQVRSDAVQEIQCDELFDVKIVRAGILSLLEQIISVHERASMPMNQGAVYREIAVAHAQGKSLSIIPIVRKRDIQNLPPLGDLLVQLKTLIPQDTICTPMYFEGLRRVVKVCLSCSYTFEFSEQDGKITRNLQREWLLPAVAALSDALYDHKKWLGQTRSEIQKTLMVSGELKWTAKDIEEGGKRSVAIDKKVAHSLTTFPHDEMRAFRERSDRVAVEADGVCILRFSNEHFQKVAGFLPPFPNLKREVMPK